MYYETLSCVLVGSMIVTGINKLVEIHITGYQMCYTLTAILNYLVLL